MMKKLWSVVHFWGCGMMGKTYLCVADNSEILQTRYVWGAPFFLFFHLIEKSTIVGVLKNWRKNGIFQMEWQAKNVKSRCLEFVFMIFQERKILTKKAFQKRYKWEFVEYNSLIMNDLSRILRPWCDGKRGSRFFDIK